MLTLVCQIFVATGLNFGFSETNFDVKNIKSNFSQTVGLPPFQTSSAIHFSKKLKTKWNLKFIKTQIHQLKENKTIQIKL